MRYRGFATDITSRGAKVAWSPTAVLVVRPGQLWWSLIRANLGGRGTSALCVRHVYVCYMVGYSNRYERDAVSFYKPLEYQESARVQ